MTTPIALPLVPLGASLLSLVRWRPWLPRVATAVSGVVAFVLTLAMAFSFRQVATLTALPNWVGVDALGAVLLLLQGFVSMTAAIYSWGYVRRITQGDADRERVYHVNLNLFLASLFVVPILLQPALAWVAIELTTVLSVFLVGFDNNRPALEAAWKYAVITIMGATAAALGIFLLLWGLRLYDGGTAQTWTAIAAAAPRMPHGLVQIAFVLIVLGFGTKVGFVPLHTWLPDAHSQAPTPVCSLLSGVEVSTAFYVIMRFWPAFVRVPGFPADRWAVVLGLISVGVAAFLVAQVRDYKRLFAFSTVEHMGLLLTALGLGPMGTYASIYQLVAHGLTKSLAFYASGGVLLATGTREIGKVQGLMRGAPLEGWMLLLSALAVGGAPPFAVFLSELAIVRSAFVAEDYVVVALTLGFVFVAFAGMVWHVTRMVFGPTAPRRSWTAPRSLKLAGGLAVVPVIGLGLYLPPELGHLFALAASSLGR